jgi:hypothetical protein
VDARAGRARARRRRRGDDEGLTMHARARWSANADNMIQIRKDKREEAMMKKRRCARDDDAREAENANAR